MLASPLSQPPTRALSHLALLTKHTVPDEPILIISLFSGPGGMDEGFKEHGFEPVIAIDASQPAVDSYNANNPIEIACRADLAALSDAEVITLVEQRCAGRRPRGVIGGPPCQSVSVSNVHAKRNDPRKKLLMRYAKLVKALNEHFQLDFFVFENVVGLKAAKHKRYFRKITKTFEDAGFRIFEQELNAKNFGVAQNRRRVFIVGINKNLYPNIEFNFPAGSNEVLNVVDAIGGLPEPVFYSPALVPDGIPHHPNHWAMNPRSPKFTNGSTSGGRSFRRLTWDRPSWTVAYGHREMHVHPRGTRRVSIYEAMLLQGFPKNYKLLGNFTEQVVQVSNAVPPPLASAVAKAIRGAIYDRVADIQQKLLAWFAVHGRDFPWRRTNDPYQTLIAEKLLQQTAAGEHVRAAYINLIESYPTLEKLARASVEDLRRIILSLGFTYRADELPRLAQAILTESSGRVPDTLIGLLALPGVGDYAARAVLSFAHGQDVPIVDTNIARLLYRMYGIDEPLPNNPARSKRLLKMAAAIIPAGKSREFNLASLDLCSAVCTSRQPKCESCPIQRSCVYGQSAHTRRLSGGERAAA